MSLSFTISDGSRQRSHSHVPSPVGLMTKFYTLSFETPPTWRARSPYLYPPGTVRPNCAPRHGVPFSSPPTPRRATVEVFDPASTRDCIDRSPDSPLIRYGPYRMRSLQQFLYCFLYSLPREGVYRPLPRNEMRGYKCRHSAWWQELMKCAVEMGSGAMTLSRVRGVLVTKLEGSS
jgi:hypothetical protein